MAKTIQGGIDARQSNHYISYYSLVFVMHYLKDIVTATPLGKG
jgi:hypothetical protein